VPVAGVESQGPQIFYVVNAYPAHPVSVLRCRSR